MDCQRPYGYNQRGRYNQRPYSNMNNSHMNNSHMNETCHESYHDNCGDKNEHMEHFALAMTYIRMQPWNKLYEPCKALMEGTAFPDLNKIFCGTRRS